MSSPSATAARSPRNPSRAWTAGIIFSRMPRDERRISLPDGFAKLRAVEASRIPVSRHRPRSDEFLDVFSEQVDLQVHRVPGFSFPQRGNLPGMRDDPDSKRFLL